jgi:hypothetical protein
MKPETEETVTLHDGHLRIGVAQWTNGPWKSTWMLLLGSVDEYLSYAKSPTYPNREEAVAAACDAVWDMLRGANKTIKGKDKKLAVEIGKLLDEVDKREAARKS